MKRLNEMTLEELEKLKKQIADEAEAHFRTFFTAYNIHSYEYVMDNVVNDVLETSALEDEGYYTQCDIGLACQRVIMSLIEKAI